MTQANQPQRSDRGCCEGVRSSSTHGHSLIMKRHQTKSTLEYHAKAMKGEDMLVSYRQKIWGMMTRSTSFLGTNMVPRIWDFSKNMHSCFICVHVWAPGICLESLGTRKFFQVPKLLELELWVVMSHPVGAGS